MGCGDRRIVVAVLATLGRRGDRRHIGHSFRVALASELTARGASTTEIMLPGGWPTADMVADYSADAKAEGGAVRKYP